MNPGTTCMHCNGSRTVIDPHCHKCNFLKWLSWLPCPLCRAPLLTMPNRIKCQPCNGTGKHPPGTTPHEQAYGKP